MVTENQIYEESDIDLGKYAKVIIKNKHVFFAILLLSLIVGICMIRFSPKIYKVSMMIKPPNLEEYFSNDKELENAEILKSLIVNSVFNEELFKRIKPNTIEIESIKFNAEIPDKSNVLLVNLDWDSKTKDLGVAMLNNLIDVISANYTQKVMVKNNEIVNRVKFNELAISNDKEKIKSIKNQIAEA